MKKGFLLCSAVLLLFTALVSAAESRPLPPTHARAYILMDARTGRILAAHNAYAPYPIASLTKLMTLYLLFEAVQQGRLHLDQRVMPSYAAVHTAGSCAFLQAGVPVTVRQLILGMTVDSGNDAAVQAAILVGGSVPAFVRLMNKTARDLGMKATVYGNPHGLPMPGTHSSAYDLALLSRAIIRRFPHYLSFFGAKYFVYNRVRQRNSNLLLWKDSRVDGLKTGYTNAAGHCLVATAMKGKERLIAVVLGVPSFRIESHGFHTVARSAENLLIWGYAHGPRGRMLAQDP
ncbi:MAG: D-alanyl-D-alanine carboxypeptidase [Gammaproteobacteria bacterium]|nr:D-alanyl-D-alanine carboxypeptidase [Gammaproteobacteria bacterium]